VKGVRVVNVDPVHGEARQVDGKTVVPLAEATPDVDGGSAVGHLDARFAEAGALAKVREEEHPDRHDRDSLARRSAM
jgi:hypothetical protein